MSPIHILTQEYLEAKADFEKYAVSNIMFNFLDGDQTYYKLLLRKQEAYLKYKEAELLQKGESYSFNKFYKPVIQHRIQCTRERMVKV